MPEEQVSEIAMLILYDGANQTIYSSGKRFSTPDDQGNYWELGKLQLISEPKPGFIHFACFGWDPEGKAWGYEMVHAGHYTIFFDQSRIEAVDMDAEALAAAAL